MDVSVVIPTLNEAAGIAGAVGSVAGEASQVIVADGGSTDGTRAAARALGAEVLRAPRGRGAQMDCGARAAKAEVLLFLHADTRLAPGWKAAVESALSDRRVVAGGFSLAIDSPRRWFRVVEAAVSLRSRFNLLYGDQAIFARRAVFVEAGGFGGLPLMEDVDCMRRLARRGRIALLAERAVTSPRRWEERGLYRATLRNWLYLAMYYAGVSPKTLYRLYYGGERYLRESADRLP
ncbi:MAG TPA: glycosyltransferase [Deltaproteobacteria bacterium]|nr:glycosyltransferase [Deltaproteobacteria bacterium]